MNVTPSNGWPCAQLAGKCHKFSIVDQDSAEIKDLKDVEHEQYYKLKTHNTTSENHEYLYFSDQGLFPSLSSYENPCKVYAKSLN